MTGLRTALQTRLMLVLRAMFAVRRTTAVRPERVLRLRLGAIMTAMRQPPDEREAPIRAIEVVPLNVVLLRRRQTMGAEMRLGAAFQAVTREQTFLAPLRFLQGRMGMRQHTTFSRRSQMVFPSRAVQRPSGIGATRTRLEALTCDLDGNIEGQFV